MKRAIGFIILTVMIYSLGCGGGSTHYPLPPADAKADGWVSEARPFEIGSEKYEADFGTITVPENRSQSTSRLISIPFIRIHSRSKNPAEPVFGLAGGPGASNMSWGWGKAQTFLSERDFVLVGYRGVDGSIVLNCPEMKKAFKGKGDLLGEESMKTIGSAWSACAERLKAKGVDFNGYSIPEVIEDNESVRRALGYERINLLSESYGTRVAYLYGLKHPEHIFRSAMISVNPPGHFVWEPRVVDAQLRHYAALWSKDSVASSKSADLYATMRTVLTAMPRRWLVFPINAGKVKLVTFAMLFHRQTAAMVFDAYAAAGNGDPSGLALMSLAYDFIVPPMMTSGDLGSKAIGADYDSTRNYCADMDPPDLPLGSPMSKIAWCPQSYGGWPSARLPEEFRKLKPSNVETLLLSGSIDFSTPAEFATKELLPVLKNGRQVIFSECGHVNDMWYANVENTRLILTSFYKTGVADTSKNAKILMDFSVKRSFPTMAKMALGIMAFVAAALIAVLVWLVRKLWKRKGLKRVV